MPLKVSKRSEVPPFIVMDVMRQAAERERSGDAVYHLEVGQPGTSAPMAAQQAVVQAMSSDKLGYTLARGLPQLQQGIVAMYQQRYACSVDPDSVFITTGSSSGFILAFLSAFDAGDRVALASPGYPAYRNILTALGIEVVDIQADLQDGFQPTPAKLQQVIAASGPIDGLIVASPSNPCGSMLSKPAFESLSQFCEKRAIRLVSDEIYHGVTYGIETATGAGSDDAIVVNSFSKYYSMTGWRVGWLLVPQALRRQMECLAQNLFICPPTVSQVAALAALSATDELELHLQTYKENRIVMLGALADAGIDRVAPADGAFYAYADFSDFTTDSLGFCSRMLQETGIAATPGVDFDPVRGHKFVRFSYCADSEQIRNATRVLVPWLRKQPRLG